MMSTYLHRLYQVKKKRIKTTLTPTVLPIDMTENARDRSNVLVAWNWNQSQKHCKKSKCQTETVRKQQFGLITRLEEEKYPQKLKILTVYLFENILNTYSCTCILQHWIYPVCNDNLIIEENVILVNTSWFGQVQLLTSSVLTPMRYEKQETVNKPKYEKRGCLFFF